MHDSSVGAEDLRALRLRLIVRRRTRCIVGSMKHSVVPAGALPTGLLALAGVPVSVPTQAVEAEMLLLVNGEALVQRSLLEGRALVH